MTQVPIALAVRRDDMLCVPKTSFWLRDGLGETKRVRVCASDNENSRTLFSLLRVLVADAEDLAAISRASPTMHRTAKDIAMLNVRNEREMLRALKGTRANKVSFTATGPSDSARAFSPQIFARSTCGRTRRRTRMTSRRSTATAD